jgi:C2H2-type zinc finger
LEDVHIPTHTQKVFTCNICSRQLQTVETLTQHLLYHAEVDRAKTSPVKDKQLLPMLVLPQILLPEEKKRCWPCRRVFPSEEELTKHKIVHQYSAKVMDTTDRRISCKLCSSKFESEIWLAQHYVDKHHIMSALRYPCNLCNISYPTLVDRSKHLCRKNLSNKYEIFWDRV